MGPSKVVNQGVHEGSHVLLGMTSEPNLSIVLPLKIEPDGRSAEHTQTKGPAQEKVQHGEFTIANTDQGRLLRIADWSSTTERW
jgi:hypothetical protein